MTADKWIPLAHVEDEHVGMMARIPDGDTYRVGRIRIDRKTLALDNASVVDMNGNVELLDLSGLGPYDAFLRSKTVRDVAAHDPSKDLDKSRLHPSLYPHQVDGVTWAYRKERAALFENFGLGKTRQQLQLLSLISEDNVDAPVLQVAPLGVHQEFLDDAVAIDVAITRLVSPADAKKGLGQPYDKPLPGVNLVHYEPVRDGKVSPRLFVASSLDEAACLRSMGSSQTFRNFMTLFEGLRYKFVATATPSPNDLLEICAYSAYLEQLTKAEILTRYFMHDKTKGGKKSGELVLNPEFANDFYIWLSSWGLFLESPEDLGHDGSAYVLPPLTVNWNMVEDETVTILEDRDGQKSLAAGAKGLGLKKSAAVRKATIGVRLAKLVEIVEGSPDDSFVLWHDMNDERDSVMAALPGCEMITGTMPVPDREAILRRFKEGEIRLLAIKPSMYGAGCNLQKNCHRQIFMGPSYKAHDVLHGVRRVHRFGQKAPEVIIDMIYTRAQDEVKRTLEYKWAADVALRSRMCGIVREHGMVASSMQATLVRETRLVRKVSRGPLWEWINNDSTREFSDRDYGDVLTPSGTQPIRLWLTSIPFGPMYQYTNHVADIGFSDDYPHFWAGMDHLTPHLLRLLEPGRMLIVHVKDRIMPGNMSGLGFPTIVPFSDMAVKHYVDHGFHHVARVTVATDVVRENNDQGYRLGYSAKKKDATPIGHGLPEYLLVFRKAPTDTSTGSADVPVEHVGPRCMKDGEEVPFTLKGGAQPVPGTGWSRARWQVDAAGIWRSSGNRLPEMGDLLQWEGHQIRKAWCAANDAGVYDYHGHVRLLEGLLEKGRLPPGFELLPALTASQEQVWQTVRMRTLNTVMAARGQTQHLCPMQTDLVERCIALWSNPGDVVADPFGGVATTPLRAAEAGRFGLGCELSPSYWQDGLRHLEILDGGRRQTTIFDILETA